MSIFFIEIGQPGVETMKNQLFQSCEISEIEWLKHIVDGGYGHYRILVKFYVNRIFYHLP